MKPVKSLKPRQISALQLLAVGTPLVRVAESLSVSVMTVHRWRQLPEFERTLTSITHSGLDEIAKKMNVAALTAVETIQEILCDLREPSAVRLKAALGALQTMPKVSGALEKGIQHRVADFDLRKRFDGPAHTHGSDGRPYPFLTSTRLPANSEVMSGGEVEV